MVKYCSNCMQILEEKDKKKCPNCKANFKKQPYIEDKNLVKVELSNTTVDVKCNKCSFDQCFKVGTGLGFCDTFSVYKLSLAYCPECKTLEIYDSSSKSNLCSKCNSPLKKLDLYENLTTKEIVFYDSSKFVQIIPECPECHEKDLSVGYGKLIWFN